ncbi:hypothetical protein J6590_042174 [Homalodisca vitripennis]|nr:hypothetical protein J6590_042174 [Homalodisca vitripennis]
MTLKNSHLAKQIMDSIQIGQTRYEMQIEELEKENEKLLSRIASLIDTIKQLEIKLSKEKELRIQLEALFEEQDQDKEKYICKYENDILQLKETIEQLKNENQNIIYKNTKSSLVKKNSGTQTYPTTSETPNNSPVLLTQIAQLSIRQDTLEQQMKSLQEHSKILDLLCLAKSETDKFRCSGETIPHHLVQDRTKNPNEDLTGRVSQTPTKKLKSLQTGRVRQTPTKKLKNSKNILTNPTTSFTNTNANKMRRDNMFSVSLQVAKSKAQVYSAEVPTPPVLEVNITHPVYPQLGQNTQIKSLLGFPRSLPVWAKIREEGESVQEFFNRYIEEYKIISLGTQPKHEAKSGQEHCPGKAHLSTTAENSNSNTENDNYPDILFSVQHNQADSHQPLLDGNDTSQSTNPQIYSDISTDMSTFLNSVPRNRKSKQFNNPPPEHKRTGTKKKNHRLGGVAIYCRESLLKDIEAIEIAHLCEELLLEAAMVRIKAQGKHFHILGVYRPPGGNTRTSVDILSHILDHNQAHNKLFILIGDINIDNLKENSPESLIFNTKLATHNMRNYPSL